MRPKIEQKVVIERQMLLLIFTERCIESET